MGGGGGKGIAIHLSELPLQAQAASAGGCSSSRGGANGPCGATTGEPAIRPCKLYFRTLVT